MTDNTQETTRGQDLWDLLHLEVYTPRQAAEVLSISEGMLLKAAYGGDLKAEIINGDVIGITRTNLVAWLKWRENR